MAGLLKKRERLDSFIHSVFEFLLGDEFHSKFYFDSQETELQFNQIK
jgi:hypothetical protein